MSALTLNKIINILLRILKKIFLSPSSTNCSNSALTLSTMFWVKFRGPSVWSSSGMLLSAYLSHRSASISLKSEMDKCSFCLTSNLSISKSKKKIICVFCCHLWPCFLLLNINFLKVKFELMLKQMFNKIKQELKINGFLFILIFSHKHD